MRLALQLMTTALMAAMDPHFGPSAERRQHHRRSVNRKGVKIYDPRTYRSGDPVIAERLQAERRARKRREWVRQHKQLSAMQGYRLKGA